MKTLAEIVAETFDVPLQTVNDALSRDNLSTWDSFNHLLLISEIEKQMGVSFTMQEANDIRTYKQLREKTSHN